jgi:hypothetical protein
MYFLDDGVDLLYFFQEMGGALISSLILNEIEPGLYVDETFQDVVFRLVAHLHHDGLVRQYFFDVFGLTLTAGGCNEPLYLLELGFCQADGDESFLFLFFHGKVYDESRAAWRFKKSPNESFFDQIIS